MTPYDALQTYWGYKSFRPSQEKIIQSVLGGQDTIALLPTGGGKSICFQIPAIILDGVTLVISPLIALMNDQVAALKRKGIRAEAVHSGMHYRAIERTLDEAQFGKLKLLYVSPERLSNPAFVTRLRAMSIALMVVDEAHCISQWGYDFRPAYLKIGEVRSWFSNLSVLAVTATATRKVVSDIGDKLGMVTPEIIQGSFLRPNLSFGVLYPEDKKGRIIKLLKRMEGASIIYVRSRKNTHTIARLLTRNGIKATFYHAGLDMNKRSENEKMFMEGGVRVMVATNAFGMGIDKADIRMVIHFDLPDSLEAYYQEAGRAGRDEKRAYAIILYLPTDIKRLEKQFEQSFPPMPEIKRTYRALGNYLQLALGGGEGQSYTFDITNFAEHFDLDLLTTYHCMKLLEQAGWFSITDRFYHPSQIQFKVDSEVLYDYQLRYPKQDLLIRTLLRLYEGILHHLVTVREKKIAGLLRMPEKNVIKSLHQLESDGLILYIPHSDTPRLVFLRERVPHQNIVIDKALYIFRKDQRRTTLDYFLQYLDTRLCRQRFILEYFHQKLDIDCGICDNCRKRKRMKNANLEFRNLKEDILDRLKNQPISIEKIMALVGEDHKEIVLKVLQHLLDEEIVQKKGEQIHLNQ